MVAGAFKILSVPVTAKEDAHNCSSHSKFGERKVEFTVLAILIVFAVYYIKVIVKPFLSLLISNCRSWYKQTNGLQKKSLEQLKKDSETLTKLELAKLYKTPEY